MMRTRFFLAVVLGVSLSVGAAPQLVDVTPPAWKMPYGRVYTETPATFAFEGEGPLVLASRTDPTAEFHAFPCEAGKITLTEPGWYEFEAKDNAASLRIRVAVLPPQLPEARRKKSVFGLWTVHGDPRLVALAGGNWNRRMSAFFSVTEAEANAAAVGTDKDKAVSATDTRAGLKEVGVFSFGMPYWTMNVPADARKPSYGSLFYPAKDWNLVSHAVTAYARSHALPRRFSVYNEPLSVWKGTPEQWVDYVRAVRRGLKAADPTFKIGGPGLYSIRLDDFSRMIAAGILDELDFIDFHAYVGGTAPEGEFIEKIDALKECLVRHGKGDLPVALTEFGWTAEEGTWQPPVNRLMQAQYTARSLLLAWSAGIDALVYFALDFRTPKRGEAGFSLVDDKLGPTCAYSAFAAVAQHFGGIRPCLRQSLAPGVLSVMGIGEGDTNADELMMAVWSADSTEHLFKIENDVLAAYDYVGKRLPSLQKGSLARITSSPIYLKFRLPKGGSVKRVDCGRGTALPKGWTCPQRGEGTYARLVPTAEGLQVEQFALIAPLQMQNPRFTLNASGQPILAVTIVNQEDTAQSFDLTALKTTRHETLAGKASKAYEFLITDAVPCVRRRNRIILENAQLAPQTNHVVWTYLPVTPAGAPQEFGDFTRFEPMGSVSNRADFVDCQGRLSLVYDAEGLRMLVDVTDDEHQQTRMPNDPAMGWSEDSLQIGFDLDYGKPWEAGFAGGGESTTFAGHRVFEWTVAGDGTGSGTAYLARSRDPNLPEGTVRPAVRVDVKRMKDNLTHYSVFFPWSELSLQKAPKAGEAIGFALVVNDVDPKRGARRHALRLFGGVAESKEPRRFGPAILKP